MTDFRLSQILADQFSSVWQMLTEAINGFTPKEWHKGKSDFMVPARLAYHAIQAVDFHLDAEPGNFNWNAGGINWEESPPEELPDQVEMLEYLERTKTKSIEWIENLGEEGLLGPEPKLGDWFSSTLEHGMYVLRHTQYHLGHLDSELHRRGLQSPEWR